MSDTERLQQMPRLYPLPLEPGVNAEIALPRRLTAAMWDRLMIVLDAMRPGLVDDGLTATEAAAQAADGITRIPKSWDTPLPPPAFRPPGPDGQWIVTIPGGPAIVANMLSACQGARNRLPHGSREVWERLIAALETAVYEPGEERDDG